MAGMSTQFDNYVRPSLSVSSTLGRHKTFLSDYAYKPGASIDLSRADDAVSGAYREARALTDTAQQARRESGLAAQYLNQFLSPGTAYAQGRGGSQFSFAPQAYVTAIQLARKEEAKRAEEASYDKAYAQALQAQEMAKTKTGVFQAGSAPQTIIGGAQGAGVEKTGQFKSMYGAGSMLPASWMQSRLDPSKVASKISGLQDRTAPEQLRVGDGNVGPKNLTYVRSKFEAPTLKNAGLGKYAPLSQLTYT